MADLIESKIDEIVNRFACEDPGSPEVRTDIRDFIRTTVSAVIKSLDTENKQIFLDRILNTPRSSNRETVSDLVDFITAEVRGLVGWQQDILTVENPTEESLSMADRMNDNQFRFTIHLNGTDVIVIMRCDNFDDLIRLPSNRRVRLEDIKGFDVVSLNLFDSGTFININTGVRVLLKRRVFREYCQMWVNRLSQF